MPYTQSVYWYRKSVEQGDASAQNNLGIMYQNGHGVAKDFTQAVYWYRKSAEQGNVTAQYNLGYMYQYGQGVAKDYAQAVYWYRKSAEQGNVAAQNELAWKYRIGRGVSKDDAKAAEWFRKSAEQGNVAAQNELAWMYRAGLGVSKDDAKAAEWYRKAAELGDADAQRRLGELYYDGDGVARDYQKAEHWYRKAAEQGSAAAQNSLAALYEKGHGVDQDYAMAVEWYRKAAENGYEPAKAALNAATEKKELHDLKMRAERGDMAAQIKMGERHEKGRSVLQDFKLAAEWYRKAAEQGSADAQNELAWMYQNGLGVAKDDAQAAEWYRKAAVQGNIAAESELALAQLSVGSTYTFGNYTQGSDGAVTPVEWIVLDKQPGRTLLISKYGLECKKYHNTNRPVTWEKSDLRAWLNRQFMAAAFSAEEQKKIVRTRNENPKNARYGTNGGASTEDKVFLLSIDEAKRYFKNNNARECVPTEHARQNVSSHVIKGRGWWWLRSPGISGYHAADVLTGGELSDSGSYARDCNYCVRPALWVLNLELSQSSNQHAASEQRNAPLKVQNKMTGQYTVKPQEKTATANAAKGKSGSAAGVGMPIPDLSGTYIFGRYQQSKDGSIAPIEWQMLAKEDGRALLISKYGVDCKKYHNRNAPVTWEKSDLRKWLNGQFLNAAFSVEEQKKIVRTSNETPNNARYGINGGASTEDKIFLLSIDEAKRYFKDDYARQCRPTYYAKRNGAYDYNGYGWWWLRSPGRDVNYAAHVSTGGWVSDSGNLVNDYYGYYCVRPALWVSNPELF